MPEYYSMQPCYEKKKSKLIHHENKEEIWDEWVCSQVA